MKKRAFDLTICLLSCPVWLPVLALCSVWIWWLEGRPIFYVSRRRVFRNKSIHLMKFRAMVKDADKLANRDNMAVDGVRFLNLPPDSPLYSRAGRLIERFHLTELPQLLHIIRGDMTLIGNRPLPENVIERLREEFPRVEDRFLVRSGLTGPVQLVGRRQLSDGERLNLESEYCRVCEHSYSITLDFLILLKTVLCCLGIQRFLSTEEVFQWMERYSRTAAAPRFESHSRGASSTIPGYDDYASRPRPVEETESA